jgi:hypothetical protein
MLPFVDLLARALARDRIDSRMPLPPAVQVRRSRLIPWIGGRLSGMGRPAAAVALGRTILVHPRAHPDERLLRHELAHVAQWSRWPITFPLRYLRAHIRHGYHDNPYEVEARAAEARPGQPGEAP